MATSMTATTATRVLAWLTGGATTAPVLPYEVRLMTANGTRDTPGTQVVGGSYAPPDVTFSSTTGLNTNAIRINDMPAVTVVGAEIWDSAATPIRWFFGPLTASRVLNAGDPVEFATGTLSIVEA